VSVPVVYCGGASRSEGRARPRCCASGRDVACIHSVNLRGFPLQASSDETIGDWAAWNVNRGQKEKKRSARFEKGLP
jgi:hypothetical protein